MSWHRIRVVIRRHVYVLWRAPHRWFDIAFWPLMDVILWGSLGTYVATQDCVQRGLDPVPHRRHPHVPRAVPEPDRRGDGVHGRDLEPQPAERAHHAGHRDRVRRRHRGLRHGQGAAGADHAVGHRLRLVRLRAQPDRVVDPADRRRADDRRMGRRRRQHRRRAALRAGRRDPRRGAPTSSSWRCRACSTRSRRCPPRCSRSLASCPARMRSTRCAQVLAGEPLPVDEIVVGLVGGVVFVVAGFTFSWWMLRIFRRRGFVTRFS